MVWVAFAFTVLALGGLLDVYVRRWRYLDVPERLEVWGNALLLMTIIYGLLEVHSGSRIRFPLIAFAMAYLLAAYVVQRVRQVRFARNRKNTRKDIK